MASFRNILRGRRSQSASVATARLRAQVGTDRTALAENVMLAIQEDVLRVIRRHARGARVRVKTGKNARMEVLEIDADLDRQA